MNGLPIFLVNSKGSRDGKSRLSDIVSRASLSIFLAYMVTIWPIVDYLGRTMQVFLVFTVLFYSFVSPSIINFKNPLINYTVAKCNKKEKILLAKITKFFWLIPSSLLGMGGLVLFLRTAFYILLSEKFSDQRYWVYSSIAKSTPPKIYYLVYTAIFIFFVLQIYAGSKLEKVNKATVLGLSLISTILGFFMCLAAVFAGIIVYYIGGSILY